MAIKQFQSNLSVLKGIRAPEEKKIGIALKAYLKSFENTALDNVKVDNIAQNHYILRETKDCIHENGTYNIAKVASLAGLNGIVAQKEGSNIMLENLNGKPLSSQLHNVLDEFLQKAASSEKKQIYEIVKLGGMISKADRALFEAELNKNENAQQQAVETLNNDLKQFTDEIKPSNALQKFIHAIQTFVTNVLSGELQAPKAINSFKSTLASFKSSSSTKDYEYTVADLKGGSEEAQEDALNSPKPKGPGS